MHLVVHDGVSMGLKHLKSLDGVGAYVGGSSALHRYLTNMNGTGQPKWKASDADIFFLNQAVNNRLPTDSIDIVQCKEKTVEELLINFDLPICRVAYNFAYDFWISAQCVAGIHTRKQNCPSYLRDAWSFTGVLETAMSQGTRDESNLAKNIHKALYNRFTERVKKYQDRGFGVNWIDTNKIIPWVTNRFHYGEWLITELPITEKVDIPNTVVVINKSNNTKSGDVKEATHCQCCHCKYISLS